MHDTFQLRRCGRKSDLKNFLGVFPADLIPKRNLNGTCSLIANTDPQDRPGQHWVAIIFVDGKGTFFDSYGMKPSEHNPSWRYLDGLKRNNVCFQQDTSDVCGDYCLYALNFANAAKSRFDVADMAGFFRANDKEGNDVLIFEKIHKMYPRILNSTLHELDLDEDYCSFDRCTKGTNQICCKRIK